MTVKQETNDHKDKHVEYNDIYDYVNSFGSYQKKVAYGTCMMLINQGMQFGHLVFVTGTPKFRCSTPNVTCGGINTCCTNCTSYEFDATFTTVVSEWNLICERSYLSAILQAMFFVGMLVGSFISGILSDTFGRRTVIFGAVIGMALCGISQSFVQTSIPLLALLRFGIGMFKISATLAQFILMMEFIGAGYRARLGSINGFYWLLGAYIQIMVAYFIRDWRTYAWVTTAPSFLIYLFIRVYPESPRWLVVKGKLKEAHKIIMKYGGKDNNPCDSEEMMTLLSSIHDNQVQKLKDSKKYTLLDLVRTQKMRRWTIISGFGWFVTSLINFAILLYMSLLPGNIYIIGVGQATITAIFILPVWLSLVKLGRRLTHCIFMVATGALLLSIMAIPKGYPTVITVLAVMGFITTNHEWSVVYLISSELFPTVLRNTAQGLGSTAARFGGIAAPFILMLAQLPGSSVILPMTIFGACALICCFVSLWLPETAGRPLYQTTIEAEESPEDYGIPFLKNRRKSKAYEIEMTKNDKP